MARKTQLERVKHKLQRDGFITNVECFTAHPAILRLGAIIKQLRERGWEIEGDYIEGTRNWKYILKNPPKKMSVEFIEKDGVRTAKLI